MQKASPKTPAAELSAAFRLASLQLKNSQEKSARESFEKAWQLVEKLYQEPKTMGVANGQVRTHLRELQTIAEVCARVPAEPPRTFHEACQFVWFVQLGGIISENPLALNLGRFDQYMYPYYKVDREAGKITDRDAQELVECLWLKLSEWVWTISSNTAQYFAGYNQFQNRQWAAVDETVGTAPTSFPISVWPPRKVSRPISPASRSASTRTARRIS
mgnify:CR=1 FL=1